MINNDKWGHNPLMHYFEHATNQHATNKHATNKHYFELTALVKVTLQICKGSGAMWVLVCISTDVM